MALDVRRIALSSPHPTAPPRFAVGGQGGPTASGDVKMFEWRRELGEMRMVGLQTDVGQIRAMTWSPDPSHPYLIACGLSSGKTHLLNLSPSTLSLPVASTSTSIPTLQVKHSRAITSLSFSPVDPSYLAVGLERHRSDPSLLIWDVQDAISRLPREGSERTRPMERIEVTNPLALSSRPGESRHIQQYCPSEQVNSVSFLPSSYTLLASTNGKQIRLYDLRAPSLTASGTASPREPGAASGPASSVWLTRGVYGLTPDPQNSDRFASWEPVQGGSTIRMWDTRKTGEVLSFDVGPGVVGLSWMAGGLGVGAREGGVGVWDIVNGIPLEGEEWTTIGGMRQIVKPRQMHSFAYAPSPTGGDVLFVLKDGTIGVGPVGVAPPVASASRGDLAIGSKPLRMVDPDSSPVPADDRAILGEEEEEAERETRENRFQLAPERITQLLAGIEQDQSESSRGGSPKPGGGLLQVDGNKVDVSGMGDLGKLIAGDIGVVMRKRAEEGYGMGNHVMNAAISFKYPGAKDLAGVWEFVNHLTQVMSPAHSTHKWHNLTNSGVMSIWSSLGHPTTAAVHGSPTSLRSGSTFVSEVSAAREPIRQGSAAWASLKSQTQPHTPASTASPAPAGNSKAKPKPEAPPLPPLDPEWLSSISAINTARTEAGHIGAPGKHALPPGERSAMRRMILALCGENHDYGAFSEINRLIEEEQRSKAAAWAYFASEEDQAIRILLQSPDPKHRLTGATLAASLSRQQRKVTKDEWHDVVDGVDDPYIRAILRKIGGDSWEAVLSEDMALLDKITIAVCNLNDKEMTEFLRDLYAASIRQPTLQALCLTGLSHLTLPLLRHHLDATGDIQTVALLASLIPPHRLSAADKVSVERWTEAYRDMLDSWRLFGKRCGFDVARMEERRRLGEEDSGDGNHCPVCNHVLSKQESELAHRQNALKGVTNMPWPNERMATCVYCGNALPRCVICLQLVEAKRQIGLDDADEYLDPIVTDTIDAAYVCCQTCRHGGHASHILGWFAGGLDGEPGHDACAVSGCGCECGSI